MKYLKIKVKDIILNADSTIRSLYTQPSYLNVLNLSFFTYEMDFKIVSILKRC